MKIVLVGYMGSGKTTVGKILAKELGIRFLDLDDHIEESEGKTIASIFSDQGEIYFRRTESQCLNDLLDSDYSFVLSTGGGTPCYGDNMGNILKATPNVFYIHVSIPELVKRLSGQKETRPLIKDINGNELYEFIGKHLFERSFFYTKASRTVLGDGKSPELLSDEIRQVLV